MSCLPQAVMPDWPVSRMPAPMNVKVLGRFRVIGLGSALVSVYSGASESGSSSGAASHLRRRAPGHCVMLQALHHPASLAWASGLFKDSAICRGSMSCLLRRARLQTKRQTLRCRLVHAQAMLFAA